MVFRYHKISINHINIYDAYQQSESYNMERQ